MSYGLIDEVDFVSKAFRTEKKMMMDVTGHMGSGIRTVRPGQFASRTGERYWGEQCWGRTVRGQRSRGERSCIQV